MANSEELTTHDGVGVKSGPMVAFHELAAGERQNVKWMLIMLVIEFGAFALLIPVLPFFLIHEIGLGPTRVGILLSAFSLAQLIGAAGSGRISDTVGRKPVIIVVFAWAGLGFGAMALVTTFLEAIVVRVLQGFSGGTAALCDAYILDVVPPTTRPSYIGFTGAVKGTAFMFGPGIGALLVVIGTDRRTVFLISGGVALCSSVLGFFVLEESLERSKRRPLCGSKPSESDEGATAADWEAISKELLFIWFCRFWSAMGLGFLFATYAFLIKDNFGWSDAHFGIILMMSGLCGALMQMLVFPPLVERIGAPKVLFLGAVLGSVAFVLYPQPSIPMHFCAMACFCISGACIEPAFPVLIGEYVGDRHLGLANGVNASFRALATVLTPLVAGSLYGISPQHCYYTAAGCFACCVGGAAVLIFCATPKSGETEGLLVEEKTPA